MFQECEKTPLTLQNLVFLRSLLVTILRLSISLSSLVDFLIKIAV